MVCATMLDKVIKRKIITIDDIVIDYPKFYSTIQEYIDSENPDLTRIELIKESIIKRGFDPLGLDYVNEKKEVDNPYVLELRENNKYYGMSGRVGRTYALKLLREEGTITEVEIFARNPVNYPPDFASRIQPEGNYGGFQKISFGDCDTNKIYGVINGRDDIENNFWYNFCMNDYFWLDKSVVDVACNIGAWSFMAKERGASEIEGFDINASAIRVANNIKELLSLSHVNFLQSSFEEYKWHKKFDVAFLNQCIYHFDLEEGEIFQKIAPYADFLFMYTFMTHRPEGNPGLGTYIPTINKLKCHLIEAGYENIYIVDTLPVITAIKNKGKYSGKMYVICCKNGIEQRKLKYFRFDLLRMKTKNLVIGVFSGNVPQFLQWWIPLEKSWSRVVFADSNRTNCLLKRKGGI